jgi:hypothetical protein
VDWRRSGGGAIGDTWRMGIGREGLVYCLVSVGEVGGWISAVWSVDVTQHDNILMNEPDLFSYYG